MDYEIRLQKPRLDIPLSLGSIGAWFSGMVGIAWMMYFSLLILRAHSDPDTSIKNKGLLETLETLGLYGHGQEVVCRGGCPQRKT